MMIDHIGISVSDSVASRAFYSKVLAPLGFKLITEVSDWAGYGKDGKAEFWFGPDEAVNSPMHIAFVAESREAVDLFYNAVIEAGAINNGEPGIRETYHRNYYGAFVIDPDGHNIEAVCHRE